MWIKLFLIIVALTCHATWATDQCPKASDSSKNTQTVDLSRELPPLRDQDSIGWCYGFVAADLWGHYLFKNPKAIKGHPKRSEDFISKRYSVSALGVATFYNKKKYPGYAKKIHGKALSTLVQEKKKVVAEAGNVMEAIGIIKEEGFCFEKDVSSEDFSLVEDSRCAFKGQCNITDILNMIYDSSRSGVSCSELQNIGKVFPNLDLKVINNILTSSEKENAITRLVEASCKSKYREPLFIGKGGPPTVNYNIEGGTHKVEDMMKSLDDHLDRGIPVGVLYFSDFLNGVDKKSSRHASSIIGKRFNPKTCEVEYQLRNSWGTGCGNYQRENPGFMKCLKNLSMTESAQSYFNNLLSCRKSYPALPRNPRVICEESTSSVYVRRSDLEKYTFATTAIEEDEITF